VQNRGTQPDVVCSGARYSVHELGGAEVRGMVTMTRGHAMKPRPIPGTGEIKEWRKESIAHVI
jgi:hypothetical protein